MCEFVEKRPNGAPNRKLQMLSWSFPDYLDIDWKEGRQEFPTPYEELTRDEYELQEKGFPYTISGVGYEQAKPPGAEGYWELHFTYWYKQALCYAMHYTRQDKWEEMSDEARGKGIFLPKPIGRHDRSPYGYVIRYFRIGCQHQWKELTPAESKERGQDHWGMCWHVYECQECGMIESQDSSG